MKKTEIVKALIKINKKLDSISIHNLIAEIIQSNNLNKDIPGCSSKEVKDQEEKPESSVKMFAVKAGNKEELMEKLKEVMGVVSSGDFSKLKEMSKEAESKLGKKRVEDIREMVKKSFEHSK